MLTDHVEVGIVDAEVGLLNWFVNGVVFSTAFVAGRRRARSRLPPKSLDLYDAGSDGGRHTGMLIFYVLVK